MSQKDIAWRIAEELLKVYSQIGSTEATAAAKAVFHAEFDRFRRVKSDSGVAYLQKLSDLFAYSVGVTRRFDFLAHQSMAKVISDGESTGLS